MDSFIAMDTSDSLFRGQRLVEKLDLVYGLGSRLTVQLMRLKILLVQRPVNEEVVGEVMSRVLRSAVLTDHTFKM